MLSQMEMKEWTNLQATKEWFKFLDLLIDKVTNEWKDKVYVGETSDETVQRNAFALGQVDVLSKLRDVTIEEMIEEMYDEK